SVARPPPPTSALFPYTTLFRSPAGTYATAARAMSISPLCQGHRRRGSRRLRGRLIYDVDADARQALGQPVALQQPEDSVGDELGHAVAVAKLAAGGQLRPGRELLAGAYAGAQVVCDLLVPVSGHG